MAVACGRSAARSLIFWADSVSSFTSIRGHLFCTGSEVRCQAICRQFRREFCGCYYHLLCWNPLEFRDKSCGGPLAKRDPFCLYTILCWRLAFGVWQLPAGNAALCGHVQRRHRPDPGSLFHGGGDCWVLLASSTSNIQCIGVVQYAIDHASAHSSV